MISQKAQSAVEYLMTYGWMLLVVAIVGGTIFSITGNQSIESTTGFTGNDITVGDFGITSSGLSMILQAQSADKVTVEQIKLSESETNEQVELSLNQQISLSDSEEIYLPQIQESNQNNDIDVQIQYSSEGLENITTSGTITGNLDLDENMIWKDNFCINRENRYIKTEHRSRGSPMNGGWIIEDSKCQIRSDSSNSDLTIHTAVRRNQVETINVSAEYLGTNDNDASGPLIYDDSEDRWWVGSITNDHGCNGIGYIQGNDVNCVAEGSDEDTKQEHTFDLYYNEDKLEFYVDGQKSAEHEVNISVDGVGLLSDAQSPPSRYESITARIP